MITDKEIRQKIRTLYTGDTSLWVDELAIPKRICLADMVRINHEQGMHGFEIKSEVDSLTRLESQIQYYSRVFRQCTLVVAEKHEEKAVAMLPEWWGVTVVLSPGFDEYSEPLNEAILLEVREAKENPINRTPYALTQLLWRTELMELISTLELPVDKKSRKRQLREGIVQSLSPEQLEEATIDFLLKRDGWKVPGVENAYLAMRREKREKRARKSPYRKRRVRK